MDLPNEAHDLPHTAACFHIYPYVSLIDLVIWNQCAPRGPRSRPKS